MIKQSDSYAKSSHSLRTTGLVTFYIGTENLELLTACMHQNCYIMCIFTSLFILSNSNEQLLLLWGSVYVPYLYIYTGCWTPFLFLLFCCNLLTLGCLLTPCDWLMLRHTTTHQIATYEDRAHRTVLNQNGFQSAYPSQPATHTDWSSVNSDFEMCQNLVAANICKVIMDILITEGNPWGYNWKIMTIKFTIQAINSPLQKFGENINILLNKKCWSTKNSAHLFIPRKNNLLINSRSHMFSCQWHSRVYTGCV